MDATMLERRVLDLEIRCRRLQIGASVLGAALGGACLTAALSPESTVVRAERFELVNESNEVRGTLEIDGVTPRLVLVSPENESLAALCAGPSVVQELPGRAGFNMTIDEQGNTTSTPLPFEVDENAKPIRHGLAALTLVAPGCQTEMVADRNLGSMATSAGDSDLMLLTGTKDGECMSVLHLVADNDGESFGHATIRAGETGAGLALGANDVSGFEASYGDGTPSLELRDASEKAMFHAP